MLPGATVQYSYSYCTCTEVLYLATVLVRTGAGTGIKGDHSAGHRCYSTYSTRTTPLAWPGATQCYSRTVRLYSTVPLPLVLLYSTVPLVRG